MSRTAAATAPGLARLFACSLLLGGALIPGSVLAQAPAAPSDPVVARVDGSTIHLSDLAEIARTLPPQAQALPVQQLYPMLLDQLIDARAVAAEARRKGLDKDPEIKRQVDAATQRAFESAVLQKEVGPVVSDAALRARYERELAGKPEIEEVHARHILVESEALAVTIIGELGKGGDFAALSTKHSKDPGAARSGGDLGFFKKDDMVPEFATAAFALKDGQVGATPVKTQFGWHVIQTIERRRAPAATFEQARDELRDKAIQDGVRAVVDRARGAVTIEKFNLDGSIQRATDGAMPPPSR